MTKTPELFDVVIVGGGAAGLSAAVALGRARRRVALIDAGDPRNAPAAGVHNFLGHDGIAPLELARVGRAEATSYGVTIIDGAAATTARDGHRFVITTAQGDTVSGRRLLIASGVRDELPDVAGLRERWGHDVLHCPYCHGWEVQDRAIGVIAHPGMPSHQALMFRQWSDGITLFTNAVAVLNDDEREQLAARGIVVVEEQIAAVEAEGESMSGIRTVDGVLHALDAIAVASIARARVQAFASLGLAMTEAPMGFGTLVEADAFGQTSVAGVWAAGNVTDLRAQVVSSAAAGLNTAAAINSDLIIEDTRLAVERHRALAD